MNQKPIHSFKNSDNFNYFKELSSDLSKFLKNKDLEQNQISIFSEAVSNTNLKADSAFWAYLNKLNEHQVYE